MEELPVIQKTYDCIRWYVPLLNKLPRQHRFNLGDRVIDNLYELLEELVTVRYSRDKLSLLEQLNGCVGFLESQLYLM